jgi:hypothetical protein
VHAQCLTQAKISPSREVPFTAQDGIALGSLSEALTRLVFFHPQVRALRAPALMAARDVGCIFDEFAGLLKPVFGHDQDLLPLKYFKIEIENDLDPSPLLQAKEDESEEESRLSDLMNRRLPPPQVCAYYDAMTLRARTLMRTLQNREALGMAHAEDGHLVPIAHRIWSHECFFVHPWSGDVYEARPDIMIKKWTGVIVMEPGVLAPSSMSHVKPAAHDQVRSASIETQNATNSPVSGRTETKTTSYSACVVWLKELIGNSAAKRSLSKRELWARARDQWPGTLSYRGFEAARDEAIRTIGAADWAKGGRPRKSQH